jgi:hypothetical protein
MIKYCPRIKMHGQEMISVDLRAKEYYDKYSVNSTLYRAFQVCFFDPRNKESHSMVNLIRVLYIIIFDFSNDSQFFNLF